MASSHKTLVESFLRLTRAWNLLIIVFAQYFTAFFLAEAEVFKDIMLFLVSLSTVLIAAGGYVINDYYDVKIDYVNNPERVVVGKTIHRRFVILLHVGLSMLGIFVGLFVSWKLAAVNVLSVSILWFYSSLLKRLPFIGNFTVALLTGASIAILVFLYEANTILILIYALFSFFITLVREIIKDMEDLKGDNTYGCKTLPIVWGIRKTKITLYLLIVTFLISVVAINQLYVKLDIIYFVMLLFVPLAWLTTRLVKADTRKDYGWLSSFCKVIMLLGILSMTLL
ncbi:MAG TPA: geranylgeranylglycerol-phosphate geranylgeranyltransferase [Cyclobacteriaceae bacterium]|nr:geranylgeranylglycerol-phosphate geranylgeranyltransferase [Cyclobacteriaceae bacterium]